MGCFLGTGRIILRFPSQVKRQKRHFKATTIKALEKIKRENETEQKVVKEKICLVNAIQISKETVWIEDTL